MTFLPYLVEVLELMDNITNIRHQELGNKFVLTGVVLGQVSGLRLINCHSRKENGNA